MENRGLQEYYNDLTNRLNELLLPDHKKYIEWSNGCYLMGDKIEYDNGIYHRPIRLPGATRGHVEYDGNDINKSLITKIVLYKDSNCFIKDADKIINKEFVGKPSSLGNTDFEYKDKNNYD